MSAPSRHPKRPSLCFAERVALFVSALHGAQADALLEGFSSPHRERALSFSSEFKTWDSAQRQARLAHQFSLRPDTTQRVQLLVLRTSGKLRGAVVAALPLAMRSKFPQFSGALDTFDGAVRALAPRLAKEALS